MPDPFKDAFGNALAAPKPVIKTKNPVEYNWGDGPWIKNRGHDPIDSSDKWYKFHQPPFDPYSMSWPQISDINKSMESIEEQEAKFQKDMKKHKSFLPFQFPDFGKGGINEVPPKEWFDEQTDKQAGNRLREAFNNARMGRK